MKNRKYYLNQSGLALISLTFILLSLVLVIFLTAYSLGNEARKDTRRYITDLRTKRFHRALLGQRTEQTLDRTPVGMGGFLADFGLRLLDVHGYQAGQLYDRRYVRTKDKQLLWVPDFFYNPSKGTWSGYRGKRYLYPLPAEEWPEALLSRTPDDTSGIGARGWKNGEGERFWWYHSCAGPWNIGSGSTHGGANFKKLLYRSSVTIKVKDYTCRAEGALKLKMVLNKNGYPYEYTRKGEDNPRGIGMYDPVTETFAGYNMHYFYISWKPTQKAAVPSERCSRMTIYLQTENPAGSGNYVTMRTYPLFVQIYLTGGGDRNENRFVKNITYRESK